MYVVKLEGETVRMFSDPVVANAWAMRHCHGNFKVCKLVERSLPRASSRIYPNEDMPELRYRPFMPVG